VIEAPVERLKARGFPRTLSAVLILVGFLAVLGGVGYLLVSSINHQIGALGDDMRRVPQRVEAWVQGFQHRFPGIADRLKDFKFGDALANFVPSADRLGGIVSSTFEALTYLVVTFFTVLYMLVEGPDGLKAFRRLLPKHARLEATKLFDAMGKAHRGWFLASVGNVASSAVMTSIGLWICGVPGAVVLGTIAGLGELIPNVGPILGALPALLLTLVIKPEALMWVVMMFLIVQTIQSYTISPLMMKIGVELPVLVTIIAVLVMGTLFGLLGVIVAIPLTADLVVAWNYVNTMLDKDTADYDNSNPKPDPVRQAAGPTTIGEQQAQSAEATGRRRFWTRRRRKNPDAHVPRPAADAAPPRAPDPRA
jgi:predicted PurR-regulated permease PerM